MPRALPKHSGESAGSFGRPCYLPEHHPCGARSSRSGRAPWSLTSESSANCSIVGPAGTRLALKTKAKNAR